MPRPHRLLLVAAGEANTGSTGTENDVVACRLEVDDQPLESQHFAGLSTTGVTGTLVPSIGLAHTEVSGVLPAGTHRADLACGAVPPAGQIAIAGAEITAVAIGAG